jgi:tetratricopeptide (TPR) repeat protein
MAAGNTIAILRVVIGTLFVVTVVGWFIWHTIRKSEDAGRMVFKWFLTAGVLAFMWFYVAPVVGEGGWSAAMSGIPLTALSGLALAIIWRHSIAAMIAKPFTSLYDGGDTPPEPRPAYSIAMARQKQGKYLDAVLEVQKQLDRFPTDFEGHMLMAEVQAQDLKDLPAAEMTIQRLVAQNGHAAANITFALYSMADWYLAIGRDREAARRLLEQVLVILPETEFALGAAHRIAHLGTTAMLLGERKRFAVEEGVRNLGLLKNPAILQPQEASPAYIAGEYVKHLAEHPLDVEAREKLAILYADHYARLDLAITELEQMIDQPHQPARLIVHWLNLIADLQIRCGAEYDAVRATLQRIIDRGPSLAAAQMAYNRIDRLKLEIKAQEKNQAVKMGTYEQNIGLKQSARRE